MNYSVIIELGMKFINIVKVFVDPNILFNNIGFFL